MREAAVASDQSTLATVLGACSSIKNLTLGVQFHAYTVEIGCESTVPVANALLTMYAQCGSVQMADLIFQSMPARDIISWTTMVTAYSQMGDISNAHALFNMMPERNIVTWNSMLAAYIQHGHAEEGLKMYIRMLREADVQSGWIAFTSLLSDKVNVPCYYKGVDREGCYPFPSL